MQCNSTSGVFHILEKVSAPAFWGKDFSLVKQQGWEKGGPSERQGGVFQMYPRK